MLIEFRIKNFRSIRDEQVLSLVATKDKAHEKTHLIPTKQKTLPAILRSLVIYGPNAGGKSNLVSGLAFFRALVAESATTIKPGQTLNIQPFKLDLDLAEKPSEFELTFIDNNVRYQYGFKLTTNQITEEWLLVYKTHKPQHWFTRRLDEKTQKYEYEFGSNLLGQKKQWQEATRPNALFLSTAAQWNSKQLNSVFEYITTKLVIITSAQGIAPDYSTSLLDNNEWKKTICDFLSSADISITDITVDRKKGFKQTIQLSPELESSEIKKENTEFLRPRFHHETINGSADFELQDESLGTQRLFSLAGPILEILQKGKTLVVDELDSSLHTLLVQRLVKMFHSNNLNNSDAQLIFTTHDTALLDTNIFRRDQVWFIEKDQMQSTSIYPLSDFSPRKNEALEKGYLMGRYGGLPFFSSLNL